jgi:hypothetical protein
MLFSNNRTNVANDSLASESNEVTARVDLLLPRRGVDGKTMDRAHGGVICLLYSAIDTTEVNTVHVRRH